MLSDLRYALRQLTNNRAFTAVALLTLAVERTPLGDTRGQAAANLSTARTRLTEEQHPEVEKRLAAWRALLAANAPGR